MCGERDQTAEAGMGSTERERSPNAVGNPIVGYTHTRFGTMPVGEDGSIIGWPHCKHLSVWQEYYTRQDHGECVRITVEFVPSKAALTVAEIKDILNAIPEDQLHTYLTQRKG